MKLISDTNILFSFFNLNSFTRKFLLNTNIQLISSEKAIGELRKYSKLIMKKTGLNKNEFEKELNHLKKIVKFEKKIRYSNNLKEAENISPDQDDADFLALCLKYNCLLWSNDKELKNQDKVKVLNTKEIIDLIF